MGQQQPVSHEFPTEKKLEGIPFGFETQSQAVNQHGVQRLCLQRLCVLAPCASPDLQGSAFTLFTLYVPTSFSYSHSQDSPSHLTFLSFNACHSVSSTVHPVFCGPTYLYFPNSGELWPPWGCSLTKSGSCIPSLNFHSTFSSTTPNKGAVITVC